MRVPILISAYRTQDDGDDPLADATAGSVPRRAAAICRSGSTNIMPTCAGERLTVSRDCGAGLVIYRDNYIRSKGATKH